MHQQAVAHAFAVDEQRLQDALQRVEAEVRDRKRHLHVEQVAERAEAGIEQDVADLGEHFAAEASTCSGSGGSSVSSCFRIAAAAVIEDQQRVAGDRSGEDLVHAGDVFSTTARRARRAARRSGESKPAGTSSSDTVAGQLRQRRGRPAEPDVQQFVEGVLLGG